MYPLDPYISLSDGVEPPEPHPECVTDRTVLKTVPLFGNHFSVSLSDVSDLMQFQNTERTSLEEPSVTGREKIATRKNAVSHRTCLSATFDNVYEMCSFRGLKRSNNRFLCYVMLMFVCWFFSGSFFLKSLFLI